MSKRQAENPKNNYKKAKVEEESDVDEDGNDETVCAFSHEPDSMRTLVESFINFAGSTDVSLKNLEKTVTEWAEARQAETGEIIDVTTFMHDFRGMYRNAIKLPNMTLVDSAKIVEKYLGGEKVINIFPDLPKKPVTVIQAYIKEKKLSNLFADLGAAHEALKKEPASYHEKLQKDAVEGAHKYAEELEQFLERHPTLTEKQRANVENRIRLSKKKGTTQNKTPRKPKKEETAFTLWCKTKADKYRDLSEEDRNKKLLKKFSKLSEPEVRLLEDLALSH